MQQIVILDTDARALEGGNWQLDPASDPATRRVYSRMVNGGKQWLSFPIYDAHGGTIDAPVRLLTFE